MRYLRQLLIVPFIPVVVLLYTGWDTNSAVFALSGLILAFWVGILPYSDVSFDGTAFATVMQTGISGRADRLGRMLGAAGIGVPLTLLADVLISAVTGGWSLLPAVIGASIALVFAGYGVSAVSSARLIVPAPEPGDSAFKRQPGAGFGILLWFMVCWVVSGVVAAPAWILAIAAAVTGSAMLSWIALAVGIVIAPIAFAIGIAVGGRTFDRQAPAMLLRLKALRGT